MPTSHFYCQLLFFLSFSSRCRRKMKHPTHPPFQRDNFKTVLSDLNLEQICSMLSTPSCLYQWQALPIDHDSSPFDSLSILFHAVLHAMTWAAQSQAWNLVLSHQSFSVIQYTMLSVVSQWRCSCSHLQSQGQRLWCLGLKLWGDRELRARILLLVGF